MNLEPRTIGPVGVGLTRGPTRTQYLQAASQVVAQAQSISALRRAQGFALAAMSGVRSAGVSSVVRYANAALGAATLAQAKAYMGLAIQIATADLRRVGLAGVGMGALNTADPTLASTSSALAQSLDTAGCQNSFQQNVADFQTAYNNAGGSPALKVDGLYGENTAGALQTTVNGPVVAGCVGQASSGGGTPSAGGGSTAPVVSQSVAGTDLLPLALAGVVGAGLIGWAMYAKKRRGVRVIHRPIHHRR